MDPDGRREWPVDSLFNGAQRRHENNYRTTRRPKHNGVDINLGLGYDDLGAPIYATHDGIVTRLRRISDDNDGGGNRIQIKSKDGTVSTYFMHLYKIADIKVDEFISEGELIGFLGGSGKGIENAYKPHLHYEIKVNGEYINPAINPLTLVDPQKFITPINLVVLCPAIIIESAKPLPNLIEYFKLHTNDE